MLGRLSEQRGREGVVLGGSQCIETGGGAYIKVGRLRGKGLNGSESNNK